MCHAVLFESRSSQRDYILAADSLLLSFEEMTFQLDLRPALIFAFILWIRGFNCSGRYLFLQIILLSINIWGFSFLAHCSSRHLFLWIVLLDNVICFQWMVLFIFRYVWKMTTSRQLIFQGLAEFTIDPPRVYRQVVTWNLLNPFNHISWCRRLEIHYWMRWSADRQMNFLVIRERGKVGEQ